MKTIKRLFFFTLFSIFISGCKKDNNIPQIILGDTVQSMQISDDYAYVLVNNSSKIEVFSTQNLDDGYFVTNEGNFGVGNGSIYFVDAYNNSSEFDISDRHLKTIDVASPRYMQKVSNTKAYITDWEINGVQVLDLSTNTITSTISCGKGPEGIVESNGFAYVCNVGGWSLDNTVSIINTSTDMIEKTLNVGDKPASIVVDANDAIWVLSEGYTEYGPEPEYAILSQTSGSLVKIVNNSIELNLTFPVGNSPSDLIIDDSGSSLYFSDGSWSKAVYSMSIYDTELPSTTFIDRNFYSLAYNDGYIYGSDAVDYVQQGWSYRYTSSGSVVDSVQVGIIPGGYCFVN